MDEQVVLQEEPPAVEELKGKLMNTDIEVWFTYHQPVPDDIPKFEEIREAAREFAYVILKNSPQSADQSAAIRKLRECVMTANAAIACNCVVPGYPSETLNPLSEEEQESKLGHETIPSG